MIGLGATGKMRWGAAMNQKNPGELVRLLAEALDVLRGAVDAAVAEAASSTVDEIVGLIQRVATIIDGQLALAGAMPRDEKNSENGTPNNL
jgi:hypothetical protein